MPSCALLCVFITLSLCIRSLSLSCVGPGPGPCCWFSRSLLLTGDLCFFVAVHVCVCVRVPADFLLCRNMAAVTAVHLSPCPHCCSFAALEQIALPLVLNSSPQPSSWLRVWKNIHIHMSSSVQALGQACCFAVEERERCSARNERNSTLMKICRLLHGWLA